MTNITFGYLRVLYGNIVLTPDGKTSVYRYRRATTTLYLAEGLK